MEIEVRMQYDGVMIIDASDSEFEVGSGGEPLDGFFGVDGFTVVNLYHDVKR